MTGGALGVTRGALGVTGGALGVTRGAGWAREEARVTGRLQLMRFIRIGCARDDQSLSRKPSPSPSGLRLPRSGYGPEAGLLAGL